MHTSKLYLPKSGQRDGADIILALPPEGSGPIQFVISRAGQSNHILGPNGWQSADYWFESESNNIQDHKAMVHLPAQLLSQFSFSNYKVLARWSGNTVTEQTYLMGGDLVPNPLQGQAAQLVTKPTLPEDSIGRIAPTSVVSDLPPLPASMVRSPAPTPTPAPEPEAIASPAPKADLSASTATAVAAPDAPTGSDSSSPSKKYAIFLAGLLLAGALAWFAMRSSSLLGSEPGALPPNMSSGKSTSGPANTSAAPTQSQSPYPGGTQPSSSDVGVNAPTNTAPGGKDSSQPPSMGASPSGRTDTLTANKAQAKVNTAPPTTKNRSDASSAEAAKPNPAESASSSGSSVPDLNRLVMDAMKK